MIAVFYDPATGRILSVAQGPASAIGDATHLVIAETDLPGPLANLPQTHYAPGGLLTACAAMTPAWDAPSQTLSGLPDPCTVRIEGAAYEVTGGAAVFGSLPAGDYRLDVRAIGHLPLTLNVTA